MRCPWLIRSVVDSESKTNSYNTSKRTEHQEFDKCLKSECPFYRTSHGFDNNNEKIVLEICGRAQAEMRLIGIWHTEDDCVM